jgi:hypothetical protein
MDIKLEKTEGWGERSLHLLPPHTPAFSQPDHHSEYSRLSGVLSSAISSAKRNSS